MNQVVFFDTAARDLERAQRDGSLAWQIKMQGKDVTPMNDHNDAESSDPIAAAARSATAR